MNQLDCPQCGGGIQGVLLTFPDEISSLQIEGTLARDFSKLWKRVDAHKIWFETKLLYDCLPYWDEFYDVSSWQLHWCDMSRTGSMSLQSSVSWTEIEAMAPSLWVEDVIRGNRIKMMCQPIVDLSTGRTYGYEMLARGMGTDGSVISPFELYLSARQQNQLFRLDRACRIAGIETGSQLPEDASIFINFVPTSIYVPEHCLATTIAVVERLGLTRDRIVFEVVETDKVQDMEHLKRILSYYRQQGFRCALDDFGEGFNNLEMLESLQPDIVKLDRKFVSDIDTDEEKQTFAKELYQRGSELGVQMLAEGIERREEAEVLAAMGYHLQQGYWYGKPSWEPQMVSAHQFGLMDIASSSQSV